MKYTINYKKLRANALSPYHAHCDDAGWDLSVSSISMLDNGMIRYGCGLAFDFSSVGFADARARSSSWKRNLYLTNGVGTIDAGYRGEVMGVFSKCTENAPYDMYMYGERFIQLVFPLLSPNDSVEFVEVSQLCDSERGSGGYGSTGK